MKKLWICLLLVSLLAGCAAPVQPNAQSNEPIAAGTVAVEGLANVQELFSQQDSQTDYTATGRISLTNSGALSDSQAVVVEGSKITVTCEGVYVVCGKLDNGMIIVDAQPQDRVQLVLQDADITCIGAAPLYVKQAEHVYITLEGSNSLRNVGGFDSDDQDAAVYAKEDITFNGNGQLQVMSPKGHGISAKDALTITGGTFTVEAGEKGHGLDANNSIAIAGGKFTVTGGKDAIHAEHKEDPQKGTVYIGNGEFDLVAADDGIQAGGWLQMDGGRVQVRCQGDGLHAEKTLLVFDGQVRILESNEGIEAQEVYLCGGDIAVNAQDDGINAASDMEGAACKICISGGEIYVQASGDGVDANGDLHISGGNITLCGPTKGDTAVLDFDRNGTVTGGTFVGTGSSMMAQSFTSASQGVLALSTGRQAEGTAITVADAQGNVLLEHTPKLDYAIFIFSSPKLIKGESYTVTVGTMQQSFVAK